MVCLSGWKRFEMIDTMKFTGVREAWSLVSLKGRFVSAGRLAAILSDFHGYCLREPDMKEFVTSRPADNCHGGLDKLVRFWFSTED